MSRLRQVKLYLGTYKSHSTAIRDTYTKPIVSSDRLQSAATALEFAVHRRLRSRNNYLCTYKVRNEIETKRNETKRNQRKRNETKRNEINKNETKRNEINEMKTK
jgi:hypothetical protein